MDDASRTALKAKLVALKQLDPENWTAVKTWASGTRPLITHALPTEVKAFDDLAKAPTWAKAFYFAVGDTDNVAEEGARVSAANRKTAKDAHADLIAFIETIVELPAKVAPTSPPSVSYVTNIHNSNVGAVAAGGSTATGNVSGGAVPTQAKHEELVKKAKKALVEDELALAAMDPLLEEALRQFLVLASKIQIEQQSMAETQKLMKDTLDELWAEAAVKGMKPPPLNEGLHVIKALSENPIMALAVKSLLGG